MLLCSFPPPVGPLKQQHHLPLVYPLYLILLTSLVPGRTLPTVEAAHFARAVGVGGVRFTVVSRRHGAQNQ